MIQRCEALMKKIDDLALQPMRSAQGPRLRRPCAASLPANVSGSCHLSRASSSQESLNLQFLGIAETRHTCTLICKLSHKRQAQMSIEVLSDNPQGLVPPQRGPKCGNEEEAQKQDPQNLREAQKQDPQNLRFSVWTSILWTNDFVDTWASMKLARACLQCICHRYGLASSCHALFREIRRYVLSTRASGKEA